MTRRFAAEGYASAAAGRRACAESDPGLERGDYDVAGVRVRGRRATVRLAKKAGGTRVLGLVRVGGEWRIDMSGDETVAALGQSLPLREDYLRNGSPVTLDLRIAVLDVAPAPAPERFKAGAGRHWVRVGLRVRSRGTEPFDADALDLKAIASDGRAYYPAAATPFEPAIADMPVTAERDAVTGGYLAFAVSRATPVREIRVTPSSGEGALRWRVPVRK
jgi:hypothetical protein